MHFPRAFLIQARQLGSTAGTCFAASTLRRCPLQHQHASDLFGCPPTYNKEVSGILYAYEHPILNHSIRAWADLHLGTMHSFPNLLLSSVLLFLAWLGSSVIVRPRSLSDEHGKSAEAGALPPSNEGPDSDFDILPLGWFVIPETSLMEPLAKAPYRATPHSHETCDEPTVHSDGGLRPSSIESFPPNSTVTNNAEKSSNNQYEMFATRIEPIRWCERRLQLLELEDLEAMELAFIIQACREALTSIVQLADDHLHEKHERVTTPAREQTTHVVSNTRVIGWPYIPGLRHLRRDEPHKDHGIENCKKDYCDANATHMNFLCNNATKPPLYGPKAVFNYRCKLCGHKSEPRNDSAIEYHCKNVRYRENAALGVLAGLAVGTMLLMAGCMHCRKVRDRRARVAELNERNMNGQSKPPDWSTLRGAIFDGAYEADLAVPAKAGWFEMWPMGPRVRRPADRGDLEGTLHEGDAHNDDDDGDDDEPPADPSLAQRRGPFSSGRPHQQPRQPSSASDHSSLESQSPPNSLKHGKTKTETLNRVPIMPPAARSSSISLLPPPAGNVKSRQPLRTFSGNSLESISLQMPTTARVARGGLVNARLSQWSEVSEPSSGEDPRRVRLIGENQPSPRWVI